MRYGWTSAQTMPPNMVTGPSAETIRARVAARCRGALSSLTSSAFTTSSSRSRSHFTGSADAEGAAALGRRGRRSDFEREPEQAAGSNELALGRTWRGETDAEKM